MLALDSDTTTSRTLKRSAIPINEVNEILSEVKAQQLLTIIDACRNDPASGRGNQDNLLSDDFARGFKVQRQAGPSGKPAVSATLYACSVGERAYEWSEKGHGVFSYYLLEGLNGQAANSQGQVTVTGLAEYAQSKVVDWAETYRNKKQTPWLSLQGGAKLVLAEGVDQLEETTAPTKINPFIDAEAEMWQLVKESNDPSDLEKFLSLFPDGKLVDVAKFKLNKLKSKKVAPIPLVKKNQIKNDKTFGASLDTSVDKPVITSVEVTDKKLTSGGIFSVTLTCGL